MPTKINLKKLISCILQIYTMWFAKFNSIKQNPRINKTLQGLPFLLVTFVPKFLLQIGLLVTWNGFVVQALSLEVPTSGCACVLQPYLITPCLFSAPPSLESQDVCYPNITWSQNKIDQMYSMIQSHWWEMLLHHTLLFFYFH